MIVAAVGAAAVLAVGAFATLSGNSDRDTNASEPTTSTVEVSTTVVSTTASATTEATSTTVAATITAAPSTTTTAAPVTLSVGHWLHHVVHLDRDDAGNLTGFEFDLVEDLMARMGAEAEWIEMDLTALYEGIAASRFDMAVGGLITTAVRRKTVPFTIPYFNRQWALIVDSSADPRVASFDELVSGDVVAVRRGTAAVEWAGSTLEPRGVKVAIFGSPDDLRNALKSGAAEAQVSGALYSVAAAGRIPPFELADAVSRGESVAIGVDPAQPELLAVVNEHLAAMIADGTYQEIYDRWFHDMSASVDQ